MPLSDEQYAARIACAVADDFATDPNLWTTGTLARDAQGNNCEPSSPDAVQFCALGRAQYYMERSVPIKQRAKVWAYFYALGRLARGYESRVEEAVQSAGQRDIYVVNDEAIKHLPPAQGADPKARARGAKAVAKFLRRGVAKTGRTCLGKTA